MPSTESTASELFNYWDAGSSAEDLGRRTWFGVWSVERLRAFPLSSALTVSPSFLNFVGSVGINAERMWVAFGAILHPDQYFKRAQHQPSRAELMSQRATSNFGFLQP